jgi:hypothetical protein
MQLAKPAGLSQHSDTLKDEQEEEGKKARRNGKSGRRWKAWKKSVLGVCLSIWTQAVFWQIYYSRPVLNFELCASIYRRNCFTPSQCLMSFSAHFLLLLNVEKSEKTRKTFSNVYPLQHKSTPNVNAPHSLTSATTYDFLLKPQNAAVNTRTFLSLPVWSWN